MTESPHSVGVSGQGGGGSSRSNWDNDGRWNGDRHDYGDHHDHWSDDRGHHHSSWSFNFYFGPSWYWGAPCYTPYYTTYYRPFYTSCYRPRWALEPAWYSPYRSYTTTYLSSSWYGGSTVTTLAVADCSPIPRYEWVDVCDTICEPAPVVYRQLPQADVILPARIVQVQPPAFQPTVYQSTELAGVLGWNDTPEAILGAVASSTAESRPGVAGQYLGRVPAGGWDVGFEADKVENGVRELWFRSLSVNTRGQRALIVVHPKGITSQFFAGQRMQITGRLAEICVDDPFEQAGRMTIEEGSIKY